MACRCAVRVVLKGLLVFKRKMMLVVLRCAGSSYQSRSHTLRERAALQGIEELSKGWRLV